jgi:hypothetical protein
MGASRCDESLTMAITSNTTTSNRKRHKQHQLERRRQAQWHSTPSPPPSLPTPMKIKDNFSGITTGVRRRGGKKSPRDVDIVSWALGMFFFSFILFISLLTATFSTTYNFIRPPPLMGSSKPPPTPLTLLPQAHPYHHQAYRLQQKLRRLQRRYHRRTMRKKKSPRDVDNVSWALGMFCFSFILFILLLRMTFSTTYNGIRPPPLTGSSKPSFFFST